MPKKSDVPTKVVNKLRKMHTDVAEHKLAGFIYFVEGHTEREIAKLCDVHPQTICNWKKTPWWKDLEEDFLQKKQGELKVRLAKRTEAIEDAYMEVVTGADKEDRTANARMKGVQMFMEMGKNPVINRNPQMHIDNSTNNNTVVVNNAQLDQMTDDELIEYNLGGEMPTRLKEINP